MDKTFDKLSIDEKLELHRAFYEGKRIELYARAIKKWVQKDYIAFYPDMIYRIAPETETNIELPWHVISPEYQWAARDENGAVWVYEEMPYQRFDMWVGYGLSCRHIIHKPGNKPWDQSLIKRPEGV